MSTARALIPTQNVRRADGVVGSRDRIAGRVPPARFAQENPLLKAPLTDYENACARARTNQPRQRGKIRDVVRRRRCDRHTRFVRPANRRVGRRRTAAVPATRIEPAMPAVTRCMNRRRKNRERVPVCSSETPYVLNRAAARNRLVPYQTKRRYKCPARTKPNAHQQETNGRRQNRVRWPCGGKKPANAAGSGGNSMALPRVCRGRRINVINAASDSTAGEL